MKRILKNTGAVLAGLLTIVILSNGTDTVLELTGVYPSLEYQQAHGFHTTSMVVLALAYRTIAAVIGGWITARLGGSSRVPVIVLASLGTLGGIGGIFAAGDLAPLWYAILIPVLSLPALLFGASWHRPRTTASRLAPA